MHGALWEPPQAKKCVRLKAMENSKLRAALFSARTNFIIKWPLSREAHSYAVFSNLSRHQITKWKKFQWRCLELWVVQNLKLKSTLKILVNVFGADSQSFNFHALRNFSFETANHLLVRTLSGTIKTPESVVENFFWFLSLANPAWRPTSMQTYTQSWVENVLLLQVKIN